MLYQLSYSCLNLRGSKPIPAEIFRWRNEELAISRGGFKPPLLTFGSTPLGVPGLLENLSSIGAQLIEAATGRPPQPYSLVIFSRPDVTSFVALRVSKMRFALFVMLL